MLREFGGVGDADVEVAIGAEDDPVDPALDVIFFRQFVGEFDPFTAGGGAAGLEGF